MSNTTNLTVGRYPLLEKYLARIPEDLRDLLVPATDHLDEFEAAIKSLRLKEEERYYVMQLQRRHGLPIRPAETVKETMIRARLTLLRKRREEAEEDDGLDLNDPLPVDPLE
jgi:hypothetical protein